MQKYIASLSWAILLGLPLVLLASRFGMAQSPKAPAARTKAVAGKQAAPTAAKKATKQAPQAKKTEVRRTVPPFLVGLTIFMLAIFVGFELISKVPPLLHSPLMSGANAISGITIVGALVCARTGSLTSIVAILGFLAVVAAMVNVVGGFLVTDRMIQMYIKKK